MGATILLCTITAVVSCRAHCFPEEILWKWEANGVAAKTVELVALTIVSQWKSYGNGC
jgi:hypothetical protein